ncbi:MAG TPA: hypothetical protein VGF99_04845 [Myxococcota bacterium]
MAPLSVAPIDPPAVLDAVAAGQIRRLLSAFLHTERQVPFLCGPGEDFGSVVEHARAASLYLADVCSSRQLKVEESDAVLLRSSSPFDVLHREVELVQRLATVADAAGDDGVRNFCDGWLRVRVPRLAM